jgi:hypothetical protein
MTGGRTYCLADALTHALKADQEAVRAGIGDDHSFARAITYVNESHADKALIRVTTSLMVKGGIELALLNRTACLLVLDMSYVIGGKKLYHCAFFDAGFEWERETLDRGCVRGRGVLKDNQADVCVHLAELSDADTKDAARAFFQEPYEVPMRIETVYELVPREQMPCARSKRQKCEAPCTIQYGILPAGTTGGVGSAHVLSNASPAGSHC